MEQEIFSLENLYGLWRGICETPTTHGEEIIICKDLEKGDRYQDILTKTIYHKNHINHLGKSTVFNPEPIIYRIDDPKIKNRILKQGYLTRKDAIEIYYLLNKIKNENSLPDKCTLLNEKEYFKEPAIFRQKEIEDIMISIALNKKITLLTGPSGIGKTAIIDELAYLFQNQELPEFLQETKLIEINLPSLTKPKEELNKILEYIHDNKAVLIVDGVIFDNNNDSYINLLINASQRKNIKVIMTSINTPNDQLSSKFDSIEIKELAEEEIFLIARTEFDYQSKTNNISIDEISHNLDDLTTIILNLTSQNEQTINQITNEHNPGFALSIIEKSFAIAKTKRSSSLEIDHIAKTIKTDSRVNPNKRANATTFLETLKPQEEKPKLFFKK